MRCLIVVLVSFGLAESPLAHADNVRSLTITDFISKFEQNNLRLKLANANAMRARADLVAARLRPNPTIAYQREQVFAGSAGQVDNFISIGWSLDLSGKRSRRIAAARHGIAAARATRDQQKLNLLIAGIDVYLLAAHARLRVDVLAKRRAPLVRFIKVLKARAAGGDVAGYGTARLQMELGQHDDKVVQANTQLAAARRRLTSLLGDSTTTYGADDTLTLPSIVTSEPSSGAVTSRSDYRAATARMRQAEAKLAAAKRSWIPRIGLTAGIKTAATGTSSATGFIAGVTLNIPLFSRGQDVAALARADRRIAVARMNLLRRVVPLRARTASETLRRLVSQARAYESKQVKAADLLVGRAELRYRGGVGSIVELVDAYQLAQRVRLRALSLRLKSRQAELTLLKIRGQRPGGR